MRCLEKYFQFIVRFSIASACLFLFLTSHPAHAQTQFEKTEEELQADLENCVQNGYYERSLATQFVPIEQANRSYLKVFCSTLPVTNSRRKFRSFEKYRFMLNEIGIGPDRDIDTLSNLSVNDFRPLRLHKAVLSVEDWEGFTLLSHAVCQGAPIPIVDYLIKLGSSVTHRTQRGSSLMYLAVRCGVTQSPEYKSNLLQVLANYGVSSEMPTDSKATTVSNFCASMLQKFANHVGCNALKNIHPQKEI